MKRVFALIIAGLIAGAQTFLALPASEAAPAGIVCTYCPCNINDCCVAPVTHRPASLPAPPLRPASGPELQIVLLPVSALVFDSLPSFGFSKPKPSIALASTGLVPLYERNCAWLI